MNLEALINEAIKVAVEDAVAEEIDLARQRLVSRVAEIAAQISVRVQAQYSASGQETLVQFKISDYDKAIRGKK